MPTTWRHTLTVRNASTGAPQTGLTVQLNEGDGTGALIGTYTDNADGAYYLDMTTIGSVAATVVINGVPQAEKTYIAIVGGDLIDHMKVAEYGGAAIANSIHGLLTGEGAFVGEDKAQTLTNKTLNDSNSIAAEAIDSGTLNVARLPTGIPDAKLAQLTTASKVAGSAVQLAATPALENSTGLRVLLPAANATLERTATGLEVKIATGAAGLKKAATGLAIDVTTMPKLTATDTVDPSAIDTTYGSTSFIDQTDEIDVAIGKLDAALYRMILDRDTPDTRYVNLYAQSFEVARNTANAVNLAVNNDDQYIWGDGTMRAKVSVPFNKNALCNRILFRGQLRNDTAGQTATIRCQVQNTSGVVQYTCDITQIGTDWKVVNAVGSIQSLAAGLYWAVMLLQSGANNAQVRGLNIAMCNDTFISQDAAIDITTWPAAEEDII